MAFGIALATTLSPALVFLATSTVMSECVFTFAQLLTRAVIERGAGQGERAWWYVAAGGVLASFTFLARARPRPGGIRGALGRVALQALAVSPFIVSATMSARTP